jgi:hypothetical protein
VQAQPLSFSQFEFEFLGKKVKGEAFLGESKKFNRYEFVQIDNANPTMFTLTGAWNDTTKSLELTTGTGTIPLKWNYTFNEDGSFVKTMLLQQNDGSYVEQSRYHYSRIKP